MPNDNDRNDTVRDDPQGSSMEPRGEPTQRDEGGTTPPATVRVESDTTRLPEAKTEGEMPMVQPPVATPRQKQRRGFAAMDPAKQREIASKGGKASHAMGTGHEWNSESAREAGRKGGQASRGGRGKLRPPTGGTEGGAT